jgi:hypothetical protein
MDTIIAATASCEVCAVIRFLHVEGQSAAEIHHRLCHVYGDNVMSETLNKLWRSIQNKRRGMLTKGVVLLHDNARPHIAARTNASTKLFNWEIFDHPPYSPDLVPSDYHLFTKMKVWLGPSVSTPTKSSWRESTIGCTAWWHRSLMRDYKT